MFKARNRGEGRYANVRHLRSPPKDSDGRGRVSQTAGAVVCADSHDGIAIGRMSSINGHVRGRLEPDTVMGSVRKHGSSSKDRYRDQCHHQRHRPRAISREAAGLNSAKSVTGCAVGRGQCSDLATMRLKCGAWRPQGGQGGLKFECQRGAGRIREPPWREKRRGLITESGNCLSGPPRAAGAK